jgi:deoxyribodipyrimidine photo-lyase
MPTSVVLFTRDLRVHDHPALTAAVAAGPVIPLFVLDPTLLGRSPNRDRFLLASLHELDRQLTRRGARLIVRQGDPATAARAVVGEAGASVLHLTEDVSATARHRETGLRASLAGVADLQVHLGGFVVPAGDLAPGDRDAYSVFTPYHRAWLQTPRRAVLEAPDRIDMPDGIEPGSRPAASTIEPDAVDLPPGGEGPGRRHLAQYLARDAAHYAEVRDDLAADMTSRLSPYLRFGCVSPNEVVARSPSAELTRQLCWRDFYGQLLASDPSFAWRNIRDARDIPEPPSDPDELLARWTAGRTGVPLVDAGMRQLRREGWMHNRARMVVASFLTRRLGIPWQRGAEVFMRYLVDGDPANNSGGWQWAAGTGTDPRRSRSFNPVRQAQRFDLHGNYIRRYVRELADIPVPAIFAPWTDPALLRATGYPEPLIELNADGVRHRGGDAQLTLA